MRKSVLLLLLALGALGAGVRPAHAANTPYYIDSVNGSDTNDGRSPENAKKTLPNVSFAVPGDRILFRAGQTFNYSAILDLDKAGTKVSPIELGRYGDGENPILKSTITRSSNVHVIRVMAPYWVINGLTIEGNTPLGSTINNNVTYETTKTTSGIVFWSSGRTQNITPDGFELEVKNCTIRKVNIGVLVDNPVTSSVYIHNNIITDLYPYTGATADGYPKGVRLQNAAGLNVIKNNQFIDINKPVIGDPHVGVGVEINSSVQPSRNIEIDHNFFSNVVNPLKIGPEYGDGGNISNVSFSYNIVKNARVLIFFDVLKENTISNGTIFQHKVPVIDIDINHNVFKNDPDVTVETVIKLHGTDPLPTGVEVTSNVFDLPSVDEWADDFPFVREDNLYHSNPGEQLPGYVDTLPLGEGEVAADPLFNDDGEGLEEFEVPDDSPVHDVFDDGEEFDPDNVGPQPEVEPISCPADISGDGFVDLSDYSLLILDFFKAVQNAINPRTDINGDGFIEISDYSLLVADFFTPCSAE